MTSYRERRPRIVIADDHPEVLVAFERLLQPSCDVMVSVANGRDAVDAVARLKPDVAVIDLMMPDMDGLEVCRRVKQVSPATEVVIVTAFDDAHVKTVSLQIGACAFVPKHSAAATLERTIHCIFAEKRHVDDHPAHP